MDYKRVKEIFTSPLEYEVSLNDVSVWIDQLHDDEKTATVHLRHSPEERFDVDISELKEEYLIH